MTKTSARAGRSRFLPVLPPVARLRSGASVGRTVESVAPIAMSVKPDGLGDGTVNAIAPP